MDEEAEERYPLALAECESHEHNTLQFKNAVGTARLLAGGTIDARTTLIGYDDDDVSLLYYATQEVWGDGVALFLEHGADPAQVRPEDWPIESPLPDYVLYLLALLGRHPVDSPLKDLEFPQTDDQTQTPPAPPTALIFAAKRKEGYAVWFLVKRLGANPCLCFEGHDALYYAMEQIERWLDRRAQRSARDAWHPVDEEKLVAFEDNIYAALAGPTDPVRYAAKFPHTVTRLRQTAARQQLRHQRDAVGRTPPLRSPAALLLERISGGSCGLHCSSSSSRSVRARTTAPP
jgi:hypothetical protein